VGDQHDALDFVEYGGRDGAGSGAGNSGIGDGWILGWDNHHHGQLWRIAGEHNGYRGGQRCSR
jgi:hypothetical protein